VPNLIYFKEAQLKGGNIGALVSGTQVFSNKILDQYIFKVMQ
jgi:hypothetical protein